MNPLSSECLSKQIIQIARCDRWQLHQRLQELGIQCGHTETGQLWVEVNDPIAMLQIRSVVRQLTSSRQELAYWLESCWQLITLEPLN